MIKDSKLDVGKKNLKLKKNLEEYTVTWVFKLASQNLFLTFLINSSSYRDL